MLKAKKAVKGFQVLEDACIWMKAGIVSFRQCDNVYDCQNCPFDKGMQRSMKAGGTPASGAGARWAEELRARYPGASRPCRHALTGRIDAPKICTQNYECYHCAFDQMLDETDLTELSSPPAYERASGYRPGPGLLLSHGPYLGPVRAWGTGQGGV